MGIFYSAKKSMGALVGSVLLLTIVGLFISGGKVFAAGESYSMVMSGGKPTVTVSGGDLKGTTKLNYIGTETSFGLTYQIAKGQVTYKTGCTFDLSVGVGTLDDSVGTIMHADGSGTNPCDSTITQPYLLSSSFPLSGPAAKSGAIIWNDTAPDQNNPPATETVTLKSLDGKTVYGTQTVGPNPQSTDVSYTGQFSNPNGLGAYDFLACSQIWQNILATTSADKKPCQQEHKAAGATLSITLGNQVLACPDGLELNAQGSCDTPSTTTTCSTTDANGNCTDESDTINCNNGSANWLVCPLIDLGGKAANVLDSFIMNTLDIDIKPVFDQTNVAGSTSAAYYTAWNSFRIIGISFLVIAGLVMVVSQAFGFEFLDAYTIRKTLPRLLIAIIGISLSWQLMRLAVSFFDTLGFDVRELIYAPFRAFHSTITINSGVGVFATLGIGAAILVNPASLTFIITALLGVLVGYFILVLRQVALIMLIITAPAAIAFSVLPNTQKVWKLWFDNFLGLLLMFPIISALIAAGHVFSAVALKGGGINNSGSLAAQALAIIAYFLPYFALPIVARMVTGVIGNLAGFVNDTGKGAFDGLKKFRANANARKLHDLKTGNGFKSKNFAADAFNATTRNVANLPNAGLNPWKMRSRMQAAAATGQASELAEYMDKNAAFGAFKGNDEYTQATMKNMGGGENESDWRHYLQAHGYTGRSLEQGVATIRAAKREVSSDTFQKAAVIANAATGTGWKEGGAGAMMESINEVAGDDRHTAVAMLAQMRGMASQSGRLDLAGSGFGKQAGAMNDMYKDTKEGKKTRADIINQANKTVHQSAIFTKGPGEYARARGTAIMNMAPQMLDDLRAARRKVDVARASGSSEAIVLAERALAQEYAAMDNLHDNLNHMAPENARIIADRVLSQLIEPGITVMDAIKTTQSDKGLMGKAYSDTRKSYDRSQYEAEGARPTDPAK